MHPAKFKSAQIVALSWVTAFCLTALAGCSSAPPKPDHLALGNYDYTKVYLSWMIPEQMAKFNTEGLSIAIVDDQQIIWMRGFGFADVAGNKPASAQTVYRIGSISKLFTATEVMKLAETGKLDIDQPLNAYIHNFNIGNRFPNSAPMTLRAMLAHHSGLPSDYLKGMWVQHPESLAQLVTDLNQDELAAPPQTQYKYSNLDYSLLGRTIELTTHENFPDAMQHGLLNPLGMTHSSFLLTSELRELYSKKYRDGKEIATPRLRDQPAGSMLSNVADMSQFIKFVFADGRADGQQLIRPDSLKQMFTPQFPGLPLDFGYQVGLGWMLSGIDVPGAKQVAWHDGFYPPFISSLLLLPKQKLGVVVLANSEEAKNFVDQVAIKAMELALQAKYGIPLPPTEAPAKIKAVALSPQTLEHYTGNYVVFCQASQLTRDGSDLKGNAMGNTFRLVPIAQDTFSPEASVLGMFSVPLPTLQIQFMTAAGKDTALLRGLSAPFPFQKIVQYPIPQSWINRLGTYTTLSDEQIEFQHLRLTIEDGILMARADVSSPIVQAKKQELKLALRPISDTEAIVVGLGRSEGGVVRVIKENGQDKLFYSGYVFTPTNKPEAH
jgi:CubicO group peptidase (beta-lactamase class C family)